MEFKTDTKIFFLFNNFIFDFNSFNIYIIKIAIIFIARNFVQQCSWQVGSRLGSSIPSNKSRVPNILVKVWFSTSLGL